MNINYRINQDDADGFLVLLVLGVLYSLKRGIISISDAEMFIFKPRFVSVCKKAGLNKGLINILELGCELEDVESLLPDRLESNIHGLIDRAIFLMNEEIIFERVVDNDISVN